MKRSPPWPRISTGYRRIWTRRTLNCRWVQVETGCCGHNALNYDSDICHFVFLTSLQIVPLWLFGSLGLIKVWWIDHDVLKDSFGVEQGFYNWRSVMLQPFAWRDHLIGTVKKMPVNHHHVPAMSLGEAFWPDPPPSSYMVRPSCNLWMAVDCPWVLLSPLPAQCCIREAFLSMAWNTTKINRK